jgi:putative MATE family efflux protein
MTGIITYKRIWNIAYPIILGSIIQNIIRITDTAFLGRVGETELGAAGIGSVFYMTFMMLGIGYGVGAQILVARRYGENQLDKIGKTVEHAFYFLIMFSFVVIALLQFFLPEIFNLIISSENVYHASLDYVYIRIWGLIFAFTNFTFRGLYVGIGKTKVITITTAAMTIINVLFDYVLIFGKWGFPEMGIKGAALASVIAEFGALITFIYYTYQRINYKQFNLFAFQKPERKLFGNVLNISLPVMAQNFLSFAGWMVFFVFVEKMGERPLAISNIIRSIYVIMLVPIMGYSFASNSLVSFVIGKGKKEEVMEVVKKGIKLCIASVAIMVTLIALFPHTVLSIFTDNPELIKESLPVLYVICGTSFFIGLGFVLFHSVSGTGSTKAALIIEASVFVIYVILTYYLTIIWQVSIEKVWAVEFLYGGMIAISSIAFLKYYPWSRKIV